MATEESKQPPFHWRREGEYTTVDGEAFAKKVAEESLRVDGPYQGYWYALRYTEDGYELWRSLSGHKWIYQARRVATQANVAGGKALIDVAVNTGQIARLVAGWIGNSGTNTAAIRLRDEDDALTATFASVASGAATQTSFPLVPAAGGAATTSYSMATSLNLKIPPGAKLTFEQGEAGAQNDTLTVALILELFNISTLPTWSKARSDNAADVTLAASTISEANTLQEVLCG